MRNREDRIVGRRCNIERARRPVESEPGWSENNREGSVRNAYPEAITVVRFTATVEAATVRSNRVTVPLSTLETKTLAWCESVVDRQPPGAIKAVGVWGRRNLLPVAIDEK